MRKAPKDGKTRFENQQTQPLREHRVFNNAKVVAEGWYPICKSTQIKPGQAESFKISYQRILVYRTKAGKLAAMDAFCPHMGADLANGTVVGDNIQCYFHQWQLGRDGKLAATRCAVFPDGVQNQTWPVQEEYGYIWVYSASEAAYPVPLPPGLSGQDIDYWNIANPTLFAHHHVMIVGGVDLLHFATVHGVDVDFELETEESDRTALWKLDGKVPRVGWRSKVLHWLVGGRMNYHAKVAGGSYVALAYGPDLKWSWSNKPVPPLYIAWGCVADENGISQVRVFLVTKRGKGALGWIKAKLKLALTALLLWILRDDDVKAFPYMRFNVGRLVKEDTSASRMIRFLNSQPISSWSKLGEGE